MLNVIRRKIYTALQLAMISITMIFSIPAFAVDTKMQMDGAGFANACTRADESWVSFCNGYVQAVIDSIREKDRVCLPKGATRTDIVTITEKEISSSSKLQVMNAHDAVLSVLGRIYACR